MQDIIVTGTLSYDFIMNFPGRFAERIMPDKLHCLSLSFLVDKLSKQHGGTAGNIAYSLRLLGIDPYVLAPAGDDFTPYRKFLQKHNVNTTYIRCYKTESTSAYFVMTDQDDSQIGSFYTGATKYAKNLKIDSISIANPFIVLAATEPVAMKRYVAQCQERKYAYMYDPAFQVGNFTESELIDGITHATILIGNDYEIALIEHKLRITHEKLISMVPVLITTLGARGSVIETHKDRMHIKRCDADNTSDPTGAGDAYRSGFLAGYLRELPLDVCGQMGSVAAAYTVEKYGTQTHHYSQKQFIARYKKAFGTTLGF